jgi:hypothetical protein
MESRLLRVYDLTAAQRQRFEDTFPNARVWEEMYREQQAADALRAERVRKDFAQGIKTPDTPFNRRALGLEPR